MKWIWQLCYTNMKKKGIRTWLTILGVVIGVISIVSLLSIGIGVKDMLMSEFMANDSINRIIVTGVNEGKRKDRMITDRKIKEFENMEHVKAAYPCLYLDGISMYEGYTGYGNISGVPRQYLETLHPIFGELPEEHSIRPQLLMGQGAMYMFFSENTGAIYIDTIDEEERDKIDLTGQNIQVQFGFDDDTATKVKLQVTGMLEQNVYDTYCDIDILKRYLKQVSTDGKITGQPIDENGESYNEWIYSSAFVFVDDTENVDAVIKKLQDVGFQTENEKEYLDTMQKTVKVIQIMLGGIGMIALVVAVIGIGNTMTTSVYDRVHEIGILKVLGCDRDELMYLFLLESGILGGLGGILGILCSYGIIQLVVNPVAVRMLSLEKGTQIAAVPFWLVALAFIFSIILGVLAGFFPARWAVKLKPIDAIRK